MATSARAVHGVLGQSILVDGFDFVLDLERSHGSRLVDERDGTPYLDMFSFFASNALGFNHPSLVNDPDFLHELQVAAIHKPSNSDVYTRALADFVTTFRDLAGDPALPHLFLIDTGTLAVENALKVAFDWKAQRVRARGAAAADGRVMHLTGAFHGRSGYTLSLTNTDPVKTADYPKFDWPRIDAPYIRSGVDLDEAEDNALRQARAAFDAYPDDIACFIAEPVQGEGGDRHFRAQFLQAIQQLCRERDALFIVDEVQTGCGLTGSMWAYQRLGLEPDLVAFGKKFQVCGVMGGRRVDQVRNNAFVVSSRLNSTWAGNLTDMVRARRVLEVIDRDNLAQRAALLGKHLLARLESLAAQCPAVSEPRGRGLMCAVDLPDGQTRDRVLRELREAHRVVMIGTGERGIRFRPALTVTESELEEAVDALRKAVPNGV